MTDTDTNVTPTTKTDTDGDRSLARRLSTLLDCEPDDVFEFVATQQRFIDQTTDDQSQLEFDARPLKDDQKKLELARVLARDALAEIEKQEPTGEEMALIMLPVLSAIATDTCKPKTGEKR
jgi:hypothetical protein